MKRIPKGKLNFTTFYAKMNSSIIRTRNGKILDIHIMSNVGEDVHQAVISFSIIHKSRILG